MVPLFHYKKKWQFVLLCPKSKALPFFLPKRCLLPVSKPGSGFLLVGPTHFYALSSKTMWAPQGVPKSTFTYYYPLLFTSPNKGTGKSLSKKSNRRVTRRPKKAKTLRDPTPEWRLTLERWLIRLKILIFYLERHKVLDQYTSYVPFNLVTWMITNNEIRSAASLGRLAKTKTTQSISV